MQSSVPRAIFSGFYLSQEILIQHSYLPRDKADN